MRELIAVVWEEGGFILPPRARSAGRLAPVRMYANGRVRNRLPQAMHHRTTRERLDLWHRRRVRQLVGRTTRLWKRA